MKTLQEEIMKALEDAKCLDPESENWSYHTASRIAADVASQFREPSSPTVNKVCGYTCGCTDPSQCKFPVKESETVEQEERIKVLEEALKEIIDYQMNFVELACTTTVYKIADKALRKLTN